MTKLVELTQIHKRSSVNDSATEVQKRPEFHGWVTKTNLKMMEELIWKISNEHCTRIYFYSIYFNLFSKAPITTST